MIEQYNILSHVSSRCLNLSTTATVLIRQCACSKLKPVQMMFKLLFTCTKQQHTILSEQLLSTELIDMKSLLSFYQKHLKNNNSLKNWTFWVLELSDDYHIDLLWFILLLLKFFCTFQSNLISFLFWFSQYLYDWN